MRSAIDRVTRERVDVAEARGTRLYICECCDAPVHVVRAETVHFAHRRGRARPDCEQYFPTDIRVSGRPQRAFLSQSHEGVPLSYLAFDMSVEGPELAVYLPPSTGAEWRGSVRLVASSTRTLGHAHLLDGMRIPFLLHDGQWTLSAIGEVTDEYLVKLTLGRQSLEPERNLFYATTAKGRRVELAESVRLGQAFWWIRREQLTTRDPLLSGLTIDLQWQGGGWCVYLITLPTSATQAEIGAISQWMQRRVRPSRPRVWVRSPCVRQVLIDGTEVFALADGPLTWRADQPVNFRLLEHAGHGALLDIAAAQEVVWAKPLIGKWDVEIDEVIMASIQMVPEPPAYAAAILCDIEGGPTFDIAELERYVDSQRALGALSVEGTLRCKTAAVAELLSISNRTPVLGVLEQRFSLSAGSCVDAAHFASVSWPAVHPLLTDQRQLREIESLGRWLLGVGAIIGRKDHLRLRVPPVLRGASPLYEQLARLSWPPCLAAQVRVMQRVLESDA